MDASYLMREREREIRPRKYFTTYSHHSWFHIPNYAYKKKKSERAMPSILPYIQKIYTKIRMSWVMLHLYIDRVPTFFFKGKVREFQNYLIYGNLI